MRYLFGMRQRRFVFMFHHTGWSHVSLGLHVHLASPNIELHVPFGFLRIGWQGVYEWTPPRRPTGWTWRE